MATVRVVAFVLACFQGMIKLAADGATRSASADIPEMAKSPAGAALSWFGEVLPDFNLFEPHTHFIGQRSAVKSDAGAGDGRVTLIGLFKDPYICDW